MPFTARRIPTNKMRRFFPLLFVLSTIVLVLMLLSKWSNTTLPNDPSDFIVKNKLPLNSVEIEQPRENIADAIKINQQHNQVKSQRSDLSKYIHLDLKGAPPKANAFYPNFFTFLSKLQMGVTGFVIEYEDMLPLQGRLVNVMFNFS